jgi:hypothetical protein
VSEEREKMGPGEPDDDREKISDVEAHKLQSRFSEADEKRDKIAEADEADVEGHMLGAKHSSGKNQA